jgi:hypothetical protein
MTEKEFIRELEALGIETGEAAAKAALAAALGLPYEDALEVERRNAGKWGKV